jgi:hypothetical protein
MLESLEDRTLPATVTILGSHLISAGGTLEFYGVNGFLSAGTGDRAVNVGAGTYSVVGGSGTFSGTFGTFTVSSQDTVVGTTGALVATGNTVDFDLTQLAAITINASDLTSPQGVPENVSIYYVTNNQYYNDTFYLPTGTYSLTSQAGGFPAYGTFTAAQNGSGSFVVSATTGALVATGNTIDFNLTQLAAITIQLLADSLGVPEAVNVPGVGRGIIGGYGTGANTFYIPAGTYQVSTATNALCGTFTVGQTGSGAFVVSGTTGALVATGTSIVIDPTRLAAITINVVTDSNGNPEAGTLVGVAGDQLSPEHTYYVPTGTYEIANAAGTFYGTFTVVDNGSGVFSISGTTGALVATGNTIDFEDCALNRVRITPNAGVWWFIGGVTGLSASPDTALLPDGSYTVYFSGATGGAGPATFTVGASGLSATQLPQASPLLTLALVPCAPTVGPITAPLTPVAVNTAISASASFTDPDVLETHTAVWNWGDGTTSAGTVTESNGSGSVSGSHPYTADGVYTITLTMSDDDGASGQSTFSYLVVYNPSAGFVTGGGWITSPAGAYSANPALTGKATFGLNAKYKSGDTVPSGNTEFQFPAANLNFHATSYDWLVITTNQAQYQGSGTINGAGNYGFLLTAQDGGGGSAPDKIRLMIWDKNNHNAVVYDTQPGAPITASPTTALGGGRIQVHTNAQLMAGGAKPGGADPAPLTPAELRSVVQEAIARWAAAGIDPARLSALGRVAVGIADFPGPWLGMAFPGAIWIDRDAAGYGWYLDPSPAADAAFPAAPGSAAYGKVDLLTVVEHELGYELGLGDTTGDGLMGEYLARGTRRVPAADPRVVGLSLFLHAAQFQSDLLQKGVKLDAQVLATALSVHATNATLAPTQVAAFTVSGDGAGTATANVGSNGDAFGMSNNTTMTLLNLLLAADARAVNGVLYGGNAAKRNEANNVFSAVNQAGGI